MKNSTKRFCLKLAAGFLSTALVASIALPINVLATTIDVTESLSENTTINSSSSNYSDNIIREIEEERDEFSKTFLLTDGTYYTYVSPIAIHEFIEDKWVDIDDSLSETPATILEAEEVVKEYVEEVETVSSQVSTYALHERNDAITVTCIGNSAQTETGYTLPANSALVIKPEVVTKFSMENKVLLSATLSTTINYNSVNNNRPLYMKHVTTDVTSATTYADINAYSNIYYKRYDKTKTDYTFDITDMYSKWERGNATNNGVALVGSGLKGSALQVSTPVLSIRYKDVTANDTSFTYHTLDLGRAGVLSINDVTNAFKLEQTIAGLDCSLLPVTLTKTIDSTKVSLDSYANTSSEWNYKYSLSIAGTYATLTLPQGTKIEFRQPENATTVDGYQTWEQITNEDYVDSVLLYIKETAITNNSLNDCYFDINGIEYWFNSMGRLKRIDKADKQLAISYEYLSEMDQFVISKLTDAMGNQYCISYDSYTVNNIDYVYANKIEVKDINNVAVMFGDTPLVVNVSNIVENSMIKSTFTYPSETDQPITVAYGYDLNGKLLGIQSADGTVTELHYKSADNTYLTGYTQRKNDEVINTFTITSNNTFERVFEGTLIQKETQRYDSDFQLVTYYYGDNIVSMTYDDGTIDSYAVNNLGYDESQNLIDNGDFIVPPEESLWFEFSTSFPEYDQDNQRIIIENDEANTTLGVSQFIESLSSDTTYIFSSDVNVIESIPSNDYAFNTLIELYSKTGELLKSFNLPFDVSLLNDTQTRMCAFKTDVDCDVMISVYADGNVGDFIVDNVRLYEASSEDGSIAMPGVSTSNPITTTTTENGLVESELITDGTTYMLQEYEYSSNGSKLISSTDFNGVSTYFDYSGRADVLSEKGYSLDGYYIANPICYEYNRAGLLETISQTLNSVVGTEFDLLLEYSYDSSERITSVTNNGYSYIFTYDELGNIANIKKESLNSSVEVDNNLIDYSYSNNNIGSILYSNGYKLDYRYDEVSGEIYQIVCYKENNQTSDESSIETTEYDVVGSYTYSYSNGKIIETLIDNVELAYDVKITYTDTGMDIYHNENLVYSKSKSSNNTVENYISTASGSNLLESFTKTAVTESKIGTNTEYYSEFYGSKGSLITSDPIILNFSGSNNIVKDYYGRTTSKYFTLDCDIIDSETQVLTQSDELALTHNYTYVNGDSFVTLDTDASITGTRTSSLIENVSNIISSQSTVDGVTSTETLSAGYSYIYDDRGNVRFQYLYNQADDCYYLENYYQYDEANQISVATSPDGIVFYSYDNNGNVIEKQIGGEIIGNGNDGVDIDVLTAISTSTWNSINWDSYLALSFAPSRPEKKVVYTYDSFGRLSHYREQDYTYDSNGNISTELPAPTIDIEIGYDSYGNPLKYVGDSTLEGSITADLTWNGSLLESAIIYSGENIIQKLTFEYDENGYRINKTVWDYTASTKTYSINQEIGYIWENGILLGMQLMLVDNATSVYMYTNILYDNSGVPYGITTPTGLAYYFLRDASDSIRGLIGSDGGLITYMSYDAFGNLTMDVSGGSLGDVLVNTLSALYNPCTFKGYLYDYELGMYFIQNKCYSPKFGRFLSESSLETLTEPKDEPLDMNLHLFCNNNPVNSSDVNAEWDRDKFSFTSDQSYGIQVEMSKAFLSRPFCTLYASKIISNSGSWDYLNGRSFKNMGIERIASNLFARCVGNYAESAINRVNATWGDGWIVSNRNSDIIVITETDPNYEKYLKIWLAAPSIKAFAAASGIYITL